MLIKLLWLFSIIFYFRNNNYHSAIGKIEILYLVEVYAVFSSFFLKYFI